MARAQGPTAVLWVKMPIALHRATHIQAIREGRRAATDLVAEAVRLYLESKGIDIEEMSGVAQ